MGPRHGRRSPGRPVHRARRGVVGASARRRPGRRGAGAPARRRRALRRRRLAGVLVARPLSRPGGVASRSRPDRAGQRADGGLRAGMRLSVVVTNHNYGRFLPQAIESALAQDAEVIVVDDGSTDESRDVIARYADRVRPVLNERGGQNSAVNAGVAEAAGEIVIVLDADDALLPGTAARAAELMTDGVVHVHWALREVDADGVPTGRLRPDRPLAAGDLRAVVLADGPGPESYTTAPTSGNAWSAAFLEQVGPIPDLPVGRHAYDGGPDAYLAAIAPLYGRLAALPEPGGLYRVHPANQYATLPFEA